MKIDAVYLRRFRGVQQSQLVGCSGLNVLIGRNNAGKSTLLAAIETVLDRLGTEQLASTVRRRRPQDEFFERRAEQGFELGVTFSVTSKFNELIRESIAQENPSVKNTVQDISGQNYVSVVLAGLHHRSELITGIRSLSVGPIDATSQFLKPQGHILLDIPDEALLELADRVETTEQRRSDLRVLERRDPTYVEYAIREGPTGGRSAASIRRARDMLTSSGNISKNTMSRVEQILTTSPDVATANAALSQLINTLTAEIDELEQAELSQDITIFSGSTKAIPAYATNLVKSMSSNVMLSFKERRAPIGQEEAVHLMRLKTKRGGSQDLSRIQSVVRDLLGVSIDAFEPEDSIARHIGRVEAEMDIDDFLVEANGAGIREALRIILDLELKAPQFALIEEPEVHLHPGLERVLHGYLVEKSNDIQLFIATHSANFLDASSRQTVFLVTRDRKRGSVVDRVASEDDLLKVSDDVGLKPSTVLMFDHLIFVEGPSDEDILWELSKKVGVDLRAANVAFVLMGGATRFSHFAAESMLDLLSRRRIGMTFILDRDERDALEVEKMLARAGDRARVKVLKRRELENYLLEPAAILATLKEKAAHSRDGALVATVEDVKGALKEAAEGGLEALLRLRLIKRSLNPIFPVQLEGDVRERLEAAHKSLAERIAEMASTEAALKKEIEADWPKNALAIVPGSHILDKVFSKFGFRYRKEVDAARLAKHIESETIEAEIRTLLREATG